MKNKLIPALALVCLLALLIPSVHADGATTYYNYTCQFAPPDYSAGIWCPEHTSAYTFVELWTRWTAVDSFRHRTESYYQVSCATCRRQLYQDYKDEMEAHQYVFGRCLECQYTPPAVTAAPVVTPTPVTRVRAVPWGWDTQFSPEHSKYADNQKGADRLSRLYDQNPRTSFWWIIWNSERTDDVPELTAYFNGDTVSAVGIVNGYPGTREEYSSYARIRRLRADIYDVYGHKDSVYLRVSDQYPQQTQVISLGRTYTGVSKIELWMAGGLDDCVYYGQSPNQYIVHITDLAFYQ